MANRFTTRTLLTFNQTNTANWWSTGGNWPAEVLLANPVSMAAFVEVFNSNLTLATDGARRSTYPFQAADVHFRVGTADGQAWVWDQTFDIANGTPSRDRPQFTAGSVNPSITHATHSSFILVFLTDADLAVIAADTSANNATSAVALLAAPSTAAEAPTVTIDPIPAGDESTTVRLTATVTGGRYDRLEYAWVAGGGTLDDSTVASPTWTRPAVNADADHTIDLTITAFGDGTNADANTSDPRAAAQVAARVQDTAGGGPAEEPVGNPTVTDTGWIEREETHASQEVIPLRPGIPYYIQVRSVDARYSEWGELHEVTMLPDAPAHLDWFKRTETSVQLAWADIPQATAYDLRKRIKNVAEWDAVVAETQLVHTFEGLTAGETYEFQIRARHEALATEWSPSLEVVMSDQIERVTDFRVARSQDIAIARWDEFIVSEAVPAEGDNEAVDAVSAFEYDIEGYRDDINGSKIFAVTLEATEYRFRTKPDQTYFLRVRAKTGEDDSTTDPTEPDTYTGWSQYTFST